MKAKARMTCRTGVDEDGSIDGYCFIFLDLGDRGVKLRNEEGVEGCTYFINGKTTRGAHAQFKAFIG